MIQGEANIGTQAIAFSAFGTRRKSGGLQKGTENGQKIVMASGDRPPSKEPTSKKVV